jgi:tetratricopeptide (TPR) repeat protein
MPGINLRAAFALGPDSPVSAQQVFTNRTSEIAAFDGAIVALGDYLSSVELSPVSDRRAPRKNVLTYYGVGGIGKSTLSRELENRYLRRDDGREREDRATVRIDFAEPTAFDPESYVLRIRAGLARLAPSWPAFDLALSIYWARAHPGEPLAEFIDRDSTLRRATRETGFFEQIHTTVSEIAGALPGVAGGAYKLASSLYSRLKERIASHRVLKRCELLPELLEADADFETLSYFPYLLAWDLDRLSSPHPRAAVFLDTYEAVTGGTTREFERWLQRSVFLMPNVLFVITGRNRLDWADLTTPQELDFVGTERWPNLGSEQTQDPRQHLVGYLSPSDAHRYLETVLTENERPMIPSDIRERIVSAGLGLPLYLDLAVTIYLDILGRGRTPIAADFGQPLPAVAARMLRDLGADEQELLRTAALLDTFNLDMLKAGCPQVSDATLHRFSQRPFLEVDSNRAWRYSLHSVLRDAIRQADANLPNSWSHRERAIVAARIADHLKRYAEAADTNGDRSAEVAVFRQVTGLCVLTDQFFDWLVDIAQRILVSGHWNSLDTSQHGNDEISALLLGIRSARERRTGVLDNAISAANTALERSGSSERLRQFLALHRAHALRVAGRYAEAALDYESLRQQNGSHATEAGYWLADYHYLDGRFEDALAELDQLTEPPAALHGEILRLKGHIFRVNALFSRAEACYREALELARETGNIAAEGKACTDIVQTLSWQRPEDAHRLRPKAVEINENLHNKVELVKLHAATAVTLANLDDFNAAEAEVRRGLSLTEQCGYSGGKIWCWAARAFACMKAGDWVGHDEAVSQVTSIGRELGGNRFWGDITRWWTGDVTDAFASDTRWIGGAQAARERWHSVASGHQD